MENRANAAQQEIPFPFEESVRLLLGIACFVLFTVNQKGFYLTLAGILIVLGSIALDRWWRGLPPDPIRG